MDVSVFADESRGSFITTAMSGNRKPGALVRLARQEERYRMEDKNRTEEVKRLKNQIKQMKSQRRGQTLPRQLSTLGARPSSSLAEWAAFFQNSTDPHGCRARTAESSERFTPQIMQGRFLVTPPPGTGFALVMNPSQCCNNEIGPQPGAPAPVILAGTVALYTGVTDATTIFGTGSVPVPLAGQYTSVGGEAGVGWNRCLGYQLEIVQRATALTRGATCYTSSSDMYSVFTWDSPSATFVGAAVGSLLTQSHTKREQLGFEDSKETIRKVYPGFAEPKALFNYNSMSVPNAGGYLQFPTRSFTRCRLARPRRAGLPSLLLCCRMILQQPSLTRLPCGCFARVLALRPPSAPVWIHPIPSYRLSPGVRTRSPWRVKRTHSRWAGTATPVGFGSTLRASLRRSVMGMMSRRRPLIFIGGSSRLARRQVLLWLSWPRRHR